MPHRHQQLDEERPTLHPAQPQSVVDERVHRAVGVQRSVHARAESELLLVRPESFAKKERRADSVDATSNVLEYRLRMAE